MHHYPITIVLEDIRSALNVGAIFRTCDAGGVENLLLAGITPYPPHNRIPKTALGAINYVQWEQNKDINYFIEKIKQARINIYTIEITSNSKDVFQTQIEFPAAFIFGNEITGVSQNLISQSKDVLHIPMYGRKESLNISTSCGIVIYEAIRQYNVKNHCR